MDCLGTWAYCFSEPEEAGSAPQSLREAKLPNLYSAQDAPEQVQELLSPCAGGQDHKQDWLSGHVLLQEVPLQVDDPQFVTAIAL